MNENLLRLAEEVDGNPSDQSKAQQLARAVLHLNEYGSEGAQSDDGEKGDAKSAPAKGRGK